jgi:signal transduction histidine kinase
MEGILTPLHVVDLFGSGIALLLGWFALRNREESGALPLVVITLGATVWLLAGIGRSAVPGYPNLALAAAFYFGVGITVAGWGAFALEFSGTRNRVGRRLWALLAVEPVAVAVTVLSNPVHGLFFDSSSATGGLTGLGPAYLLHTGYAYLLIGSGFVLVAAMLWRRHTLYPGQVYLVLLGVMLPWLADIGLVLGLVEVSLQATALVGTSLCLTVALFRHKLLRVTPATQGTVLDNLRDGVFILDSGGRFTDVNPTAGAVLGSDDLRGDPARPHLESHPSFAAHVDQIIDATEEETFEIGVDERYYDVRVTPLFDHREELIGRQVQLHEVTEQRRREGELERQNERLDRFASVLSHDLRNPLNVATGRAELAVETGDVSHVEDVSTALDRMAGIIDEVLTLAREGEGVESPEPVALGAVADQAWETVETGDATLAVADDRRLVAERDRTVRLLENLFRNSLEHGGPDVTVTVGALPDGFFVADDGPGIPAADRERVLEYGYSTAEDGTGFGLSIVTTIAEAHGWHVAVTESEAGGARFEFGDVETDAVATTPETAD